MKFIRLSSYTVLLLIIIALLAACSNKSEPTVVVETPAVIDASTPESGTAVTQDAAATESKPSGVPEDVPIMPDVYDLSVPSQLNVSYKVKVTIQDVVAFYQQEFANYGWDKSNNPDTVIGSMAQLARSNSAGDRLTFSIQYNSIGEFSVVQIYITRAP